MSILTSRRAVEVMLLLALLFMIAAFFVLNWTISPEDVQGVIGRKSLETSFSAFKLAQADTGIYSTNQPIALVAVLACLVIASELTLVNLWRSYSSPRLVILRAVIGVIIIVAALVSRSALQGVDVDYAIAPAGSSFDVNSDSVYNMSQAFYIIVIGAVLMIVPLTMLRKPGFFVPTPSLPDEDGY